MHPRVRTSRPTLRWPVAAGRAALLALTFLARTTEAQDFLGLPGASGAGKKHVTWQLRVEPATVQPGGKATLIAKYELAPGWSIYSPDNTSSFGIATTLEEKSDAIEFEGQPQFPPPKEKEFLGETSRSLASSGEIRQAFVVQAGTASGELSFDALLTYMACSETLCDPPTRGEPHTVRLRLDAAVATPNAATPNAATPAAETLASGDAGEPFSWLLFALGMIGGGLFTLVMPCTYPMIPITISFFTKQAEKRSGSVLPLALAYGAGIILMFNVIGWFFSASIGPFAARPEVNLIFGVAFFALGLSLLGLYTLRLPASVNSLASKAQGSSGYLGVFLLGTTLVITSFTCTAPVLGPLLVIASNGEGFERLGYISAGMTIFGLTIATPFVLLSLFPGRVSRMPRAGEWMHTLKVSLGFIELAAALKFLSNAEVAWGYGWLPRELLLVFWAGIFGVLALYLLELFHLRDETPQGISSFRLLSGLGTACLALYFAWGAIGFKLDWVTEVLVPPYRAEALSLGAGPGTGQGTLDPRFTKHHHASRETVYWDLIVDDLEKGLEVAQREKKLAFINFTGVL